MEEPIEKHSIGFITFEDTIDEGVVNVSVYSAEGSYVPHFHIIMRNKPDICVMLEDNRYFAHGIHKDTLSSKDCKILNDWLKKPCQRAFNILTNWQFAVAMWNADDDHEQINGKKANQPDYSTIKSYK